MPESADDSRTHRLGPLTQTGAILGTPGYMSPEQAAGSRGVIGAGTDIYSLGAILYAMLTGRPPFQAASPVDTVLMVLEQDPISPQLFNPTVDRDLEMIALKCLQKPAELRYAAAEELAADLEAYLADEPVSARSSRFTQILTRAFRETHHVSVLENWGLLWILHAVVLLVLCLVTNAFQLSGVDIALAVCGVVDDRPGNVGRDLLEPAAPQRADHVCRAADRPRLGRQHDCRHVHVRHRIPAWLAGAHALADARPGQRRGVPHEGGDAIGRVLHPRRRPVPHRSRDGLAATADYMPNIGLTVFGIVSRLLLFAGLEILPPGPRKKID